MIKVEKYLYLKQIAHLAKSCGEWWYSKHSLLVSEEIIHLKPKANSSAVQNYSWERENHMTAARPIVVKNIAEAGLNKNERVKTCALHSTNAKRKKFEMLIKTFWELEYSASTWGPKRRLLLWLRLGLGLIH